MPRVLDETRLVEAQTETVPNLERQNSEAPEYDEAGLRELVDQASAQIQASESGIVQSADQRVEDAAASIGLEQQKAKSIFSQNGFADRIQSAKNKITALAKDAKAKIGALVGTRTETKNLGQSGELENNSQESGQALTLDRYIKTHKHEGLDAVKDKARLALLKLKGIGNPERVLGLINYLEEKATSWEHKTLWVKEPDKERQRENYEKQGYYTYFVDEESQRGKVRLSISRDKPLRFDMSNARNVADLLNASNDPVEVLERLQNIGCKMNEHDFGLYIDNVKKFIDNPHILPLLKKLGMAKGKVGPQQGQGFFKDHGDAASMQDLAEKEAERNQLDKTAMRNLSAVSDVIGHPLDPKSLENWLTIANDPEIIELLQVARDYGKSTFRKEDDNDLIIGLRAFKDSGIAGDVAALVKEGFDPSSFSLNRLSSSSVEGIVRRAVPVVQDLKSNPDFHKFTLDASAALGLALTVDIDTMEKLRKYYKNPEALKVLQILNKFQLITARELKSGYYDLENIFNNQKAIEAITQPDFEDFFNAMSKAGYKVAFADIFSNYSDTNFLQAYRNESLRISIIKEESISLISHLGLFKQFDDWNLFALESLITAPNALENLQTLEQVFGYSYEQARKSNYRELSDLGSLLNNNNEMNNLFKPETRQIFAALGFKFNTGEVQSLVSLGSDPEFMQRIADPDVLAFVKRIGLNFDSFTIKSLANYDTSLHPVVETLQEFGSLPDFYNSGDKAKCAQLRDDPRIFETARALRESGVVLMPLKDLGKLKIIADRNLLAVVQEYKNNPDLKKLIIDNIGLITAVSSEKPSSCFQEILNKSEGMPIRRRQMLRGQLVGTFLEDQKYDMIAEMAGNQAENLAETKRIVEKLRSFVEAYKVSGKGKTVATLLAMREYREGEDFFGLLQRMEKNLDKYEKLIDSHTPRNIPQGLRTSIGMEYEITESTAAGYAELNSGHGLKDDMDQVSRFAGVGKGKDAIFEIATKPSDNPYLMLLEMQLLQDLEFIDLNFRNSGYEKGARGYHMTIGGEHGINVTRNSNFLQNALVMAGWGGVNAGKKVERLSKGRSQNIRSRHNYDTQAVFENTKPAVEFRSLSLDTWEPFERAVETSFYGAIAVQAVEKHTYLGEKGLDLNLQAVSPEQFYDLLEKEGLIREDTSDPKIKQLLFEWAKLQAGMVADLADHNENFLQNETYGYLDERGRYVDAQEFGGVANRERFLGATGSEQGLQAYGEQTRIQPGQLFEEASPALVNSCTAITNLFIKNSAILGGDVTNAASSLDTTKIGRTIEESDPQAKYRSFFDANGKTREGYYYIQGGSERMLLHQAQMRLLEFNKSIKQIIS